VYKWLWEMPVAVQDDAAERTRQTEWRERNVDKIKKSRMHRLQQLDREREAIVRATRAYEDLDQGDSPWIVLRSQFVRLETPRRLVQPEEPQELSPAERRRERAREIGSRPPLTRLVNRPTNALALYLSAVYMAHLEAQPGHAFTNRRHNTVNKRDGSKAWNLLAGMWTTAGPAGRRARMRRAVKDLSSAGLVAFKQPEGRPQYEGWTLLQEDGSEARYRRPSEQEPGAVVLPAAFFLRGWHLVLTPGEIALLLAIENMHRLFGGSPEPDQRRWIALPQSVRRGYYGISGEIYLHAQQLREFGLVEFRDPMPNRRRGKIPAKDLVPPPAGEADDGAQRAQRRPRRPLPYWFSPPLPTVFNDDAFTVVHNTLTTLSIPYRLIDDTLNPFGDPPPPQDVVKDRLAAQQLQR